MPTASVIIPAYNQAQYLGEAIQSVLNQTFRDYELIVVDDGSTDYTSEMLSGFEDPRLRIIRQSNGGLSAARNRGIRETSAPFVTFLDADDLFMPDNLNLLCTALVNNREIGLVAGGVRIIDQAGQFLLERVIRPESFSLDHLLLENPFAIGGILVRRNWFDRIGAFDETLSPCADWDLYLRLAAAGCRMMGLEDIVVAYRNHQAQMTRSAERMRQARLGVIDKFFLRDGLSADLMSYRDRASASALLKAAASEYGCGQFDMAERDLTEAVRLDPSWLDDACIRLVENLRGWSDAPQWGDSEAYLLTISEHIPSRLQSLRKPLRRAMAAAILRKEFGASRNKWRADKGALLRAVCYDPAWLSNRGVLRMLFDAWIPFLR